MYGCAITCSETSSIFGVSHGGFSLGFCFLAASCGGLGRARRRPSIRSSCLPRCCSNGRRTQLPAVRLRVASTRPRSRAAPPRALSAVAPGVAVRVPRLVRASSCADRRRRAAAPPRPSPSRWAAPAASPAARPALARKPSVDARRDRSRVPSPVQCVRCALEQCRGTPRIAPPWARAVCHRRAAVPMRISLPVLKRNAPSVAGARDHGPGLVDVDARRRESDLERQAGGAHRAAGGVRLGERAARALAPVDLLRVAVEAHLDRADRQPREPLGDRRVEALAVGLDLELRRPPRPASRRSRRNAARRAARRRRASRRARRCATISPATRIASSASSSSGSRLPGADSVQQCRQARSQSRVSCHDTSSGAPKRVDAVASCGRSADARGCPRVNSSTATT